LTRSTRAAVDLKAACAPSRSFAATAGPFTPRFGAIHVPVEPFLARFASFAHETAER
jgi:hypothetical protein